MDRVSWPRREDEHRIVIEVRLPVIATIPGRTLVVGCAMLQASLPVLDLRWANLCPLER